MAHPGQENVDSCQKNQTKNVAQVSDVPKNVAQISDFLTQV